MLVVGTYINIGGFKFPYVVETETESSWENLTDKCQLRIPRKIRWGNISWFDGERLFRQGDKVTVQHGYDGSLKTVFTGYLSRIKPGSIIGFTCEDEMYKLKGAPITASYKSISLRQLLTNHLPVGVQFQCPDVELGQFRITKASLAQVLEELKKTYGLHSWFRDGKLYSGLAYWPELRSTHTFTLGLDIIDHDSLEYWRKDEIKIKVTGISMLPNNTKIEVQDGDADGEQRTLHYYNLTESELKARVAEELDRLRVDGFTGSFTVFGTPLVRHGDIIDLKDPRGFKGNSPGQYFVKRVTYTGGVNGLRQTIELDGQAR
jgi:hypothetical protein